MVYQKSLDFFLGSFSLSKVDEFSEKVENQKA